MNKKMLPNTLKLKMLVAVYEDQNNKSICMCLDKPGIISQASTDLENFEKILKVRKIIDDYEKSS